MERSIAAMETGATTRGRWRVDARFRFRARGDCGRTRGDGGRARTRATALMETHVRRRAVVARDASDFANDGGAYERFSSREEARRDDAAEAAGDAASVSSASSAFEGGEDGRNRVETRSSASRADREMYDAEFASFMRARAQANEAETRKRWNEGAATPRVAFDLGSDYIRRVAVAYPYSAVGSARGTVAICDVVNASAMAVAPLAHGRDWLEANDRPLGERVLLGAHDGGAVTAMALKTLVVPAKGDKESFAFVASGGRDGSLRLFEASKNSAALRELGHATHDNVVTGVTFARDSLWSVALDGHLCRWSLSPRATAAGENATTKRARESLIDIAGDYVRESSPALTKQGDWKNTQPTLCMSSCEKTGLISLGNADGSAAVLSASASSFDGESSVMQTWSAHEGSTVRAIAHCPGNGIITGGGDGIIRVWRLMVDDDAGFDSLHGRASHRVAKVRCVPRLAAELRGHTAAVVSLATGCPGRLVSGAQDGTIRVWDLDLTDSKPGQRVKAIRRDARYAVLGHTVWLGSTYADSERIICDGANNVLLEYDFSTPTDDA